MTADPTLAALLAEVRRIEVQSSRLVTEIMAGGYSSVFRGPGIEFREVREYVDGDDPRAVDWSVTARVGRPFVKEYVEERERTLLFLLDLSASSAGGFGIWSARQMAARVVACLALSAVKNDDKVGLVAFGERVEAFVPPRKGLRHVLRVVRDGLALPECAGRTAIAPALEFASHVLRRRAIVFCISDFLAGDWRLAATLCARRHDLIAVRLATPELTPPDTGPMRLRDPETGKTSLADWSDPRVRAEYEARVAAWRARTTADLRRAHVDLMEVPVPREYHRDAVARPILQFFRMRELRGEKR
ncbi:MAG: DUF58 domain-containing protein [Planctomycetes bacterium]|nr:DUF58 domain-containing protein [Planctomycetota bacterium]